MAGRVAGLPEYRGLALTAGTWRIEPVALASSFRGRLAGIHGGDARAILLHTGSVHGSGLQAPLRIVHLTRCGTVVDDEVLPIEGTVRARSYWILELPDAVPAPPQGSVLRVLPSSQG